MKNRTPEIYISFSNKILKCYDKINILIFIIFSCSPEMVEGHPYGEKADIWALGCILYQMCVLDPPFFNTNMLTLVKNVSNSLHFTLCI